MLYITTRSNTESVTAARTLTQERAGDGGLFIPIQLPQFSREQIFKLRSKGFYEIVSQLLNLFFRCDLTEADARIAFGKNDLKLQEIDRKAAVLELWENHSRSFDAVENALYCRLCTGVNANQKPTAWAKIAIRTAVIFGIFTLLPREAETVDFAVGCGDFSLPMALWYCREMGLPIGNIICTTNENSATWDFFTHGDLACDSTKISTSLPKLDVAVPAEMERLIYHVCGLHESKRFAQSLENRLHFKVDRDTLSELADGFAVSVAGSGRVESIIHRIYRTNHYILDPYTAHAFGGLQDYRSVSGESRFTLLLSESSPMCYRQQVAKALFVPETQLIKLF